MWYQVQELDKAGLTKSQIHRQTGLDRATVGKYLTMNEHQFSSWVNNAKNMKLKLSVYMPFVKKELEGFPDLSAAQIEIGRASCRERV